MSEIEKNIDPLDYVTDDALREFLRALGVRKEYLEGDLSRLTSRIVQIDDMNFMPEFLDMDLSLEALVEKACITQGLIEAAEETASHYAYEQAREDLLEQGWQSPESLEESEDWISSYDHNRDLESEYQRGWDEAVEYEEFYKLEDLYRNILEFMEFLKTLDLGNKLIEIEDWLKHYPLDKEAEKE